MSGVELPHPLSYEHIKELRAFRRMTVLEKAQHWRPESALLMGVYEVLLAVKRPAALLDTQRWSPGETLSRLAGELGEALLPEAHLGQALGSLPDEERAFELLDEFIAVAIPSQAELEAAEVLNPDFALQIQERGKALDEVVRMRAMQTRMGFMLQAYLIGLTEVLSLFPEHDFPLDKEDARARARLGSLASLRDGYVRTGDAKLPSLFAREARRILKHKKMTMYVTVSLLTDALNLIWPRLDGLLLEIETQGIMLEALED